MIIFMFGIVLTIVLFIAMGFVRGEGMSWRVNKKQLLALVGVLVIVFSCYVSIPAGHTGVVTTFGSVENYTLEAGMHFKLPWQEVIKMDNRVQKSTQDMSCFSSDIQEVSMTYTVNYQISKQDAMTIYKTIGIGYYDTVIGVGQDRHGPVYGRGPCLQPQPDGLADRGGPVPKAGCLQYRAGRRFH